MEKSIQDYNLSLSVESQDICNLLATKIDASLSNADCKIWHGHPVWFLDGNPIVGYSQLKNGIRLLFWSGQSFEESGLTAQGKFKASEITYNSVDQVDTAALHSWLEKSKKIQWDYKNIVKRKGKLIWLGDGKE